MTWTKRPVATEQRESAVLLARLRDHIGRTVRRCRRCDPARGIYCLRAEPDARAFAELRRDEVYAERLARETAGG